MAYTDLWRCKRCQTLPDITFLSGKRFLIECKQCRAKASFEGSSLDDVVARWNRRNDPRKTRISDLWEAFTGFVSYRRERRLEQKAIAQRRKEDLAKAVRVPMASIRHATEVAAKLHQTAATQSLAE